MLTSMDPIFQTNDTEYGYLLEESPIPSAGDTLSLNVPKVVGMLQQTKGKVTVNGNGLFDNSSECEISYAKSLSVTEGVKAVVRDNQTWDDKKNARGNISKSMMFTVEFIDGNLQYAYVTSK